MGEILGISNLSGSLVSLQSKALVPYSLAHRLFTSLLKSISSKFPQQIIENFRAQYILTGEVLIFVFSTLTENPFLSQDSLSKLKEFLTTLSKDLRADILLKRPMEVNYGMEDILHSMDPSGRNSRAALFTISKPLQSNYSSASNLIYMNKGWKEDGTILTSAYVKATTQLSSENQLQALILALPEMKEQARPQVHPFATQFIDSAPEARPQPRSETVKRISENSSFSGLKSPRERNLDDCCSLVIMVR